MQRVADDVHSLGALDSVGLVVLLLFLVLGFAHGFVGQTARLFALGVGFLVARAGGPPLASSIPSILPDLGPSVRLGIAYALLSLSVLVATALLAALARRALGSLHLSFLDRLAGAGMGLLTGAVVHLAVLACVVVLAKEDRIGKLAAGSRSLRAAFEIAEAVGPALPPAARAEIELARARIARFEESRPVPDGAPGGP
ncbi:MAG: CvpA family protein [Planctomycetes bacterium]|nr:CvpA family protein [Planctomycetota bacterium]